MPPGALCPLAPLSYASAALSLFFDTVVSGVMLVGGTGGNMAVHTSHLGCADLPAAETMSSERQWAYLPPRAALQLVTRVGTSHGQVMDKVQCQSLLR